MRTVAIIQRQIPHYRVRFFEELYAQGRRHDLDILVYSGAPPAGVSPLLTFPYHVLPMHLVNRRSSSYWMSGLKEAVAGSDIVVAPQELQCLTVPYLWMMRKRICTCWIWWGHGYNFQAAASRSTTGGVGEFVKRLMTKRADGLITYSETGAEFWRRRGLPDRVMPCHNTIDVEGLRRAGADLDARHLELLKQRLRLEQKRVLLFSGRLYAEKRVDFLLRAFVFLQQRDPQVALLILGDGTERSRLEQLAEQLQLRDVHFLGEIVEPRHSAAYFSLADVLVLPSLVGLAIVHGFAYGLPLITTDLPGHGPELDYLSDQTGIMTKADPVAYAEAIRMLFAFPERLDAMKRAARLQGDELRLSRSVGRFLDGIDSLSNGRSRAA